MQQLHMKLTELFTKISMQIITARVNGQIEILHTIRFMSVYIPVSHETFSYNLLGLILAEHAVHVIQLIKLKSSHSCVRFADGISALSC